MSSETRLGLGVLGTALLLGVLADALLRETPLGVNVVVWVGAFVAALVTLALRRGVPLADGRRWMLPLLLLSAALYSWRDSVWLSSLDLVGIMAALGIGILHNPGVRPQLAGLSDHARGWLAAAAAACAGVIAVLADIRWNEVAQEGRSRQAASVLRGLGLTIPLLILFGALFAAADAVFEQLLGDLVPDLEQPLLHVSVLLTAAWVSAGLLHEYLTVQGAGPEAEKVARRPFELGAIEYGIILALLNLLFLAFVLVQLRYFFGGEAHVKETAGLTYAEYARHGFFELVTVAALVLPLLLLADWLRRPGSQVQLRLFRALAASLVMLLFVIMASALQRMRLYQREYGLTELRVYTTAFMLLLAVVFVWFLVTVLRGRRERFAVGVVAAGFAAIIALHAVNPDALIARTNIERAREGKPFDIGYLGNLSADAGPTLARELPEVLRGPRGRSPAAALVVRGLLKEAESGQDWRSWNWSRARARTAVRERRAELEELVGFSR